jgi:hypothetical protein
MKISRLAILAFILATTLIACKKDNDNDNQDSFAMEGVWKGTTGNGGFFGVNIKQNGTLERINSSGDVSATGTWQLSGNTLSGSYDFASGTHVVMSATVDKANHKFSGTWSNNGGEQGTMQANKVN